MHAVGKERSALSHTNNRADEIRMTTRRKALLHCVLGLMSGALVSGCSSTNPHVRVHRTSAGHLQLDGPLQSYATLEALGEGACKLLTTEPGAMNGRYGFEYCALYYYSAVENRFFLSYLSDLSTNWPDGVKTCITPNSLNDPSHKDAITLGPAHNHPHNPALSQDDVRYEGRQPSPPRIIDSNGQVWDRGTLIFYQDPESGLCNVVLFNHRTLLISALRDGKWIEIGKVINDQGHIQLHPGMNWLPPRKPSDPP